MIYFLCFMPSKRQIHTFQHTTGTIGFLEQLKKPFITSVKSAEPGTFSNYVPSSHSTSIEYALYLCLLLSCGLASGKRNNLRLEDTRDTV